MVANITGDGIPDVIFNSSYMQLYHYTSQARGGVLRALNGDGSGEIFTVTSPNTSYQANPAVADITGDGIPEILSLNQSNSRIIAFNADGTVLWMSDIFSAITVHTPVAVSDIDPAQNDGVEIIVGSIVLNNQGHLEWQINNSYHATSPMAVVADLDMDGTKEILGGQYIYNHDGTTYHVLNEGLGVYYFGLANFDNDTYPEIVVVKDSDVKILNHDGSILSSTLTVSGLGGRGGPPTIADFDNDGQAEIVVPSDNSMRQILQRLAFHEPIRLLMKPH